MNSQAETFTPEHVALVYDMYRKALAKYLNSYPTSATLASQYNHWANRWRSLPPLDVSNSGLFF